MPRALFDRLAREVDVYKVLRRAKLTRSRFRTEKPHATPAEFFALWQAVEQIGAPTDLGLRLGVETLEDYQDVSTIAFMHSANVGEGLRMLARYKRLACPERVCLEAEDAEVHLRFEWPMVDTAAPTLVTDLLFAFVLRLVQRATARPVRPRRVELCRHSENEPVLRRHFRCELRFNAEHDVMIFDKVTLGLPIVNRNDQLLSLLQPGLELAIARARHGDTFIDDLRSVLSEAMCGARPAITNVARSLGMSARTMQRRLGSLGTSYQDVLDEVRNRSAQRLLAKTDLAVGEIAFLLGFEEVNSFIRAFQGWEKATPAGWRAKANATRIGRRRQPRRANAAPRRALE